MSEITEASKIIMYTTATCASCQMVKKWLSMKNLSWEEVRVDEDPSRQQEAIDLSGQSTVPVTRFQNADGMQSVVVGFKPAQLAEAVL